MIPKVIHYCWFGRKPLPKLATKCIASWKKYFPDYEIREWNEDNFDVNQILYTKQAYSCKKYAFVSDYARFKILYDHGGIYFDTDVEVIRSMKDLIPQAPYMGVEIDLNLSDINSISNAVNPGLGIASPPKHPFFKDMLDLYKNLHFEIEKKDYALKTVTQYTSEQLLKNGWIPKIGTTTTVGDITIFPKQFFCPFSWETRHNVITDDTYSIHHYASSWLTWRQKLINKINKHRYISLFIWLIHRSPKQNIKGLFRVIRERKIW